MHAEWDGTAWSAAAVRPGWLIRHEGWRWWWTARVTETGNAETVSASDVEEAVAFFVEDTFGRMLLDGATPDQRAAALASLHEALEQKVTANGVELGGAAWIATATRMG